MKRIILLFFSLIALNFSALAASNIKLTGEKTDVVKWVDTQFAKGAIPPFSFELDGVNSSKFIRSWKYSKENLASNDASKVLRRYTWTSPKGLKLTCDVTAYPDSKVLEWVISFDNLSNANSAQISKVNSADFALEFPKTSSIDFHYMEGNWMNNTDYCPKVKQFAQNDTISFCPIEGRGTSGAFPYYNIASPSAKQGVIMALGWAGTWQSAFKGLSNNKLAVEAGVKYLDSYLLPSEHIKLASVVLMFWSGEKAIAGNNAFRRFQMKHICVNRDGSPLENKFLFASFPLLGPNPFTCHSSITEDWAIALMNRHKFLNIMPDAFWLDAGWYTDSHKIGFADATGNWEVDPERFPNGMKPVTDQAHKLGTKFMLWFEPERVVRGTQFANNYPQWLLQQGEKPEQWENWMLFDLSQEDAFQFLCKYIGDMIEQNGVDLYREDCNVMPGPIWAVNHEPGRQGIKEVHHIENHYRFWDYLLERFPNLVIDNCASGGKRLDWESVKRSYAFWQDDYIEWSDVEGLQTENYGLNYYIPIHGTGARAADSYTFRSAENGTLALNWNIAGWDYSLPEMQKNIAEYKSIRDYFSADYYPLSGEGEDLIRSDIWMAYQLHRSSDESGFVMAFRRKDNTEASHTVCLEGLNPSTIYVLTNPDTAQTQELSGEQLANGFTLELANPASALLIQYKAK